MERQKNASQLHTFIKNISPTPPGVKFPRTAWVKLNRRRAGVGLFHSEMHKWGMASMAICGCIAKNQTYEHVLTSFRIYYYPNQYHGLSDVKRTW